MTAASSQRTRAILHTRLKVGTDSESRLTNNMSIYSSEIVVGIDFGTTHSGVSWAVNGGSKVIRLIENWPDPLADNASKEKVPSAISYVDGKPQKWGYNVGLTDESFKWIKILLEENHQYVTTVEPVKNSNNMLTKVDKTALEVVADYLKLLWQYTLDDIRKFHPTFDLIFALRVVLTVPAIWSPAAKDKTKQAAGLAGMPAAITLVTEPEAAALATLKDKAEEGVSLEVGDAFVVCDAGGGTVDLISYQVEALNPLKIKECAIGSGGLCGSVFLDARFENHIATLVGESVFRNIKETYRKKMMKNFENGIKRAFSEKNEMDYSVDLKGVPDDPDNGIIDDTIVITKNTLRAIFDDIALQVEKLISDQIAEVSDKDIKVKSILLVGGFGASTYLHDRLVQCHANDGIHVIQVNRAWSSICRGATMWGLEHPGSSVTSDDAPSAKTTLSVNPTVTSRLSRYSYGMAVTMPFDRSLHRVEDCYRDKETGKWMAANQMDWLLKRGEDIEEGKILSTDVTYTVKAGFFDRGFEFFSVTLYYCDAAKPPIRKNDSVKSLCNVHFAAEKSQLWHEKSFRTPLGKKRRHADMEFCIVLGNATFDFYVYYRGDILTAKEANYAEKL